MTTIWKYQIDTTDWNEVWMPESARVLTVQTQKGKPCIWALVNPDNAQVRRQFRTIGTGQQFVQSRTYEYVGSYQLFDGDFVGHVFEVVI